MKVHRFVGVSELKALLDTGFVRPITPKQDRLYFFSDDEILQYQMMYLCGVTSSYTIEHNEYFVVLRLEIPEEYLTLAYRPYADPYGSFYDTISVGEYHLFGLYRIEDVNKIEIVMDTELYNRRNPRLPDVEFNTIKEALDYLKSHGIE